MRINDERSCRGHNLRGETWRGERQGAQPGLFLAS